MARTIAAALVLALLLVGCASDPGPADGAPTTSAAQAPAPTLSPPVATATPPATTLPTPTTLATAEVATCRGDGDPTSVGRTDVDPSGNRRALGSIDLLAAPVTAFELPARPTWIVPYFGATDSCRPEWYVTLDDGSAITIDADGTTRARGDAVDPPVTTPGSVDSAYDELARFDRPLPDSRVVSFGQWIAALTLPTDRYGHGVLGDRIEAGAVEVIDTTTGASTVIEIDPPTVIEGISPMLLDVDAGGSAQPEVLVTLSNSDVGAWLALFNLDGSLRAESDPIGRGNRWRNQLGAGQTGANSVNEIVDVRTPHLDGVVEFFRVVDDRLERTASITGYTNHTIGSRNLDLGLLVDADADKLVEVVLPTRDLTALAVIDRVGDDAVELGRVELDGSLSTNIATQWLYGQAWLAVGTSDGRLLVIGDASEGS